MANPVLPELARLAMILTARQPNRDFMQAIPGGGGNERRLELQNNMMGGGYGFAPERDFASPSGTDALGLGPAQDRSGWRDAINSMSPGAKFGASMIPGLGTVFSIANLANTYLSKKETAELAPSLDTRQKAQESFRSSELESQKSLNTPQQSFQEMEKSGYDFGVSPETGLQGGGSSSQTGLYGDAGMPGSGYGGGADAPGANADGYGGGDAGFGGNSEAFNQGGMVDAENLMGQAPKPDDGYGALQGGEYVIKKAAVDKYGQEMLDAINNGTFQFEQSLINFMATPAK